MKLGDCTDGRRAVDEEHYTIVHDDAIAPVPADTQMQGPCTYMSHSLNSLKGYIYIYIYI